MTTNQRVLRPEPSRFTLTCPNTAPSGSDRCRRTRTSPTPWTLSCFESGRNVIPSPCRKSTLSNRAAARNRGVPRRLARLHPPEERPERLIQAPQRLLLGRERPHPLVRADRPDLLELHHLRRRTDRGSTHPPGVPTFLQACVIQLSVR